MKSSVSVVIISDYASGDETSWNELRTTLKALAQQDFDEPVDFILVESAELASRIPPDFSAILPNLRVISVPKSASYELKNAAVEAVATELVAMLDGDCAASPEWLRRLVDAIRTHPDAMVVSGRTVHAGSSLIHRAMGAVDRSYVDVGQTGPTHHISNNNALYRRSAFLAHPLATDVGPFGGYLQAAAIMRGGGSLLFEPRARVTHAYEGWATERNYRRAFGYGMIRTRRVDSRVPYAWVTRLGYLSIPLFIAGHMLIGWQSCLRHGRAHGVAWYELPVAFAITAVACSMEVPGMVSALRNQSSIDTLFR